MCWWFTALVGIAAAFGYGFYLGMQYERDNTHKRRSEHERVDAETGVRLTALWQALQLTRAGWDRDRQMWADALKQHQERD